MRQPLVLILMLVLGLYGCAGNVSFHSAAVPYSEFRIRMAEKQGQVLEQPSVGIKISATLIKPEGEGPFPAIIALQHSGGKIPDGWGKALSEWGYVVLKVDSLGSRNITRWRWGDKFTWVAMTYDAIGASEYLQSLDYVEVKRIAVMGWSMGGKSALALVNKSSSFQKLIKQNFVAAIAIYPGACISESNFNAPVLVVVGAKEDNFRLSVCRVMVASQLPASAPIEYYEIPGAHHGFDGHFTGYHDYGEGRGEFMEASVSATRQARAYVKAFLDSNL